ncbi:hypothetical protein DPMN_051996 [Dreissena polymorpha]|uniref:Uncharacterized protein n=1 Tax=Dreissena polymorpha TaxID=45954 RepID=A0A9D4CKV5_DREPO|nr:hypothetical protein DPMN_051996 [Dreissena polymorpha]
MALSFIAELTSEDTRDDTEPGLGGISSCLSATGEKLGQTCKTGVFCAGLTGLRDFGRCCVDGCA